MNLSRRAILQGAALTVPWLCCRPLAARGEWATQNVRDHGARGDGKTKDTAAIQRAIDAASPGGTVVFPGGDYLSGTLHLRDHLDLRFAAGATLVMSPDDSDFDPHEKLAYETFADQETADFTFALLQGRGLRDVTIGGPGVIEIP